MSVVGPITDYFHLKLWRNALSSPTTDKFAQESRKNVRSLIKKLLIIVKKLIGQAFPNHIINPTANYN